VCCDDGLRTTIGWGCGVDIATMRSFSERWKIAFTFTSVAASNITSLRRIIRDDVHLHYKYCMHLLGWPFMIESASPSPSPNISDSSPLRFERGVSESGTRFLSLR
jgi:hypothetical protein